MSQHMEALQRANRIYKAQSDLLMQVRKAPTRYDSAERAAEMLLEPCEVADSMRLQRVMRAIRQFGDRRVGRVMADAGVPPGRLMRRLRELTPYERERLARALLQRCGASDGRPTATAGPPSEFLAAAGAES